MSIYIAQIRVDPGVVAKLNQKHQMTVEDLQESLVWPAKVRSAFEDDDEHGPRWIVRGTAYEGRRFFAVLLPEPDHEGEDAEVWRVKTAVWSSV